VPVRVDDSGEVTHVGLLLRIGPDGTVSRTLVSGRVLHHERVRDALMRHLEKDLGPVALPRVPASLQPFTVAEYFPTKGITPFHDPRQHAVSLAYVVPVAGDCRPRQDALDLVWFSPHEASSPQLLQEMPGGQGVLLKQALAHVGCLT
jgi:ADP-ribose pyrophosphatase YjhB (NUDIX family)